MKIVYTVKATGQLKKLSPPELKKVIKKIQTLEITALEGKKLGGKFAGLRSIRAWPYRIIYFLSSETITIDKIEHRQGVYK